MLIKSIHKNKKDEHDFKNQRGLFITSILSKVLEKIYYNRNLEKFHQGTSKFQTGSRKGRSTIDNLFVLQAIIDYHRYLGQNIYLIMGDAEKCFDKLDLSSCLNELYSIDMNIAEISMIETMNSNVKATINVNGKYTETINIREAVRQGTIFGGVLCSLETDKVNTIRQPTFTMVDPNVAVQSLIYVDDILGHGSENNIRGTVTNLRGLETEKKLSFGIAKTHIMKIQLTKKKNLKDLNLSVRQGEIDMSEREKYVGVTVNEKGNNTDRVDDSKNKAKVLSKLINEWGSPFKVGNLALETRIFLINNLAIQSIFHSAETWTNISLTNSKSIEGIHRNLLTSVLEVEQSTPYVGMLVELGEWPIHQTIHYKMMMLFQHLIASDDDRLATQVLISQIKSGLPKNWYSNLKDIGKKYEINVSLEEVCKYKKSQWKRMIKEKINKWVIEYYREQICRMSKLRFLRKPKTLEMQSYLKKLPLKSARMILRTKLNMVKVKGNYKGSYQDQVCEGCNLNDDTTEHLFQCWKNEWMTGVSMTLDVIHSSSMEELSKVANAISCIEKAKEIL